jgi:hypothetical protein
MISHMSLDFCVSFNLLEVGTLCFIFRFFRRVDVGPKFVLCYATVGSWRAVKAQR